MFCVFWFLHLASSILWLGMYLCYGSILTDSCRWVMYNFRILSFLVFSFLFWAVTIVSTVMFWFILSSYVGAEDTTGEVKSESEEESEGYGEDDSGYNLGMTDESTDRSSSDGTNPKKSGKKKRRRARKHGLSSRVKKEDEEIKETEEIEQSTHIEPLVGETDDDELEY